MRILFDFTSFDRLMRRLQKWRQEDHEDNITLSRAEVIELLEGVKALGTKYGDW